MASWHHVVGELPKAFQLYCCLQYPASFTPAVLQHEDKNFNFALTHRHKIVRRISDISSSKIFRLVFLRAQCAHQCHLSKKILHHKQFSFRESESASIDIVDALTPSSFQLRLDRFDLHNIDAVAWWTLNSVRLDAFGRLAFFFLLFGRLFYFFLLLFPSFCYLSLFLPSHVFYAFVILDVEIKKYK